MPLAMGKVRDLSDTYAEARGYQTNHKCTCYNYYQEFIMTCYYIAITFSIKNGISMASLYLCA